MTLTPTFVPWSVSLQPLIKRGAWLALEGQRQSAEGQPNEGLVSTLEDWRHFQRPRAFPHAREQQPASQTFARFHQWAYSAAEDQADVEFSTPRKSSPSDGFVSSLPADFSRTVTEQLLLCSQMPFFIPVWFHSERQRLGENLESKRARKSISWGFDLLHIQSLWAPCDQHYGSVLRLTWSSISNKPAWLFPPGKNGLAKFFNFKFFTLFYDFLGNEAVLLWVEPPALVKH